MLKWVEIDLKVMARNARVIRKALRKDVSFMAVVKADGKLFSATKETKVTLGGCGG